MIAGSITGALLGVGAITGGISWYLAKKKKEELRKERVRALRQKRARLAAVRAASSVSAGSIVDNSSVQNQAARSSRAASNLKSRDMLSSDSFLTIEGSAEQQNVVDSSAVSLPIIDIHAGNTPKVANTDSSQSYEEENGNEGGTNKSNKGLGEQNTRGAHGGMRGAASGSNPNTGSGQQDISSSSGNGAGKKVGKSKLVCETNQSTFN